MGQPMPTVRCPVCERRHTVEEYEEDKFCRTCSAFLRVEARTNAYNEGWRALFPYEAYKPQVDFMRDVERIVGGGGLQRLR